MKFTYKKHIHQGRYRSFNAEMHDIKLKRKIIGSITEVTTIGQVHPEEGKFKIRFIVLKNQEELAKEPNCSWKWVTVKGAWDTADDAKQWIAENMDKIKTLKLNPIEP